MKIPNANGDGVNAENFRNAIGAGIPTPINDTLVSTSVTEALAANQGRVLFDLIDSILNPAVAPGASLTVNSPLREYGADTAYTLTWSVTKNTNPITGITVDGTAQPLTPLNGTSTGNFAHNDGTANPARTMSVTDGTLTTTRNASVSYLPRMFFGNTSKTSSITDADIRAITGSELRSNRNKTLPTFGGGGLHMIFAIPTSFGAPSFTFDGFSNNAFNKVRTNSDFVNAEGATVKMDVYISIEAYNSPFNTIIIS